MGREPGELGQSFFILWMKKERESIQRGGNEAGAQEDIEIDCCHCTQPLHTPFVLWLTRVGYTS